MKFKLNLLLVLIFLCSCSTERPTGKTEAEILFKEAQEQVKAERYQLATEKLNTLKSKHPYSYYATQAELMMADVLFLQESFAESAAAYILFKDLHPKHKKMAYVTWKIAESYYAQVPSTFDRDLTPGREAKKYYKDLLRFYAGSEYIKDSQKKIDEIDKMIISRQKYIADFYFKTSVYSSARYRYLDILENFKDEALINHSIVRVVETSRLLKDKEGCEKYYNTYQTRLGKSHRSKLEKAIEKCRNKNFN